MESNDEIEREIAFGTGDIDSIVDYWRRDMMEDLFTDEDVAGHEYADNPEAQAAYFQGHMDGQRYHYEVYVKPMHPADMIRAALTHWIGR